MIPMNVKASFGSRTRQLRQEKAWSQEEIASCTGLHRQSNGETVVDGVMAAFMRYEDYRITKPKTAATTLKSSFNGDNFVSLL